MIDLERDCEMIILTEENLISDFDCGDADLNDYFNVDALNYKRQLLSRTYFFRHNCSGAIVIAFSFSASCIKTSDLPGSRRKKVKELVPREKSLKSYPAILIGRLGVAKEFGGHRIGSQMIEIIMRFCQINFSDFVRFLLVDAYNDSSIIRFYQKNYFTLVFSTEEQEKKAYHQETNEILRTRYMFYDMIQWSDKLKT